MAAAAAKKDKNKKQDKVATNRSKPNFARMTGNHKIQSRFEPAHFLNENGLGQRTGQMLYRQVGDHYTESCRRYLES